MTTAEGRRRPRAPFLLDAPPEPGRQSRRLRAARIARLLEPSARAVEGYVSTHLLVPSADGRMRCPDVAVARGKPPVDGRADGVPELVVLLAAGAATAEEAEMWLDGGALAVWCIGEASAVSYAAARGVRHARRGRWLTVPGVPLLRMDTADLPP